MFGGETKVMRVMCREKIEHRIRVSGTFTQIFVPTIASHANHLNSHNSSTLVVEDTFRKKYKLYFSNVKAYSYDPLNGGCR